ncbi:hypothetical protein [Thalassomonas actiniarum]|uniref:Uncharacterized protein n=1 Tax=Thalassomonas actiniarum TaxID=485447 RepID=A0AAF0C2Y0_9GAMM|nr:hypothetical protein [Thalassomonas actiniarum]WDD98393.1 hypothetical protein SG35_024505 [Thalassomonas actiniarum]
MSEQVNTQINIKALRSELKAWGKFWRKKESVNGFASSSIRERYDSGTGDKNRAENIYVPGQVEELTHFISRLRPECIRALRARYVVDKPLDSAATLMGFDSKRSLQFWLAKAERGLISAM